MNFILKKKNELEFTEYFIIWSMHIGNPVYLKSSTNDKKASFLWSLFRLNKMAEVGMWHTEYSSKLLKTHPHPLCLLSLPL